MKSRFIALCSKKSLPKIREFVRQELSDMEIQATISDQLVLAMDEACANSIIHQHKCDGTSNIELVVYRKGNAIHFEIRDVGSNPFPIEKYKPEELQSAIKARKKGGLGIMLITKIMDEVKVEKGKAEFTYHFIKYLK